MIGRHRLRSYCSNKLRILDFTTFFMPSVGVQVGVHDWGGTIGSLFLACLHVSCTLLCLEMIFSCMPVDVQLLDGVYQLLITAILARLYEATFTLLSRAGFITFCANQSILSGSPTDQLKNLKVDRGSF